MACKCSPSLVRLMADFAELGHVDSGCCAGAAHHQANPNSDHEADSSGYAHAQDIHEQNDHDMQPFVDYVMAHPGKYRDVVKYMIYEGHIYYPNHGARPAGKYVYTGPNAHAAHLHVSIFRGATFWAGDWHVADAYSPPPTTDQEDEEVLYVYTFDHKYWLTNLVVTRHITGQVDFDYLVSPNTPSSKPRVPHDNDMGEVHPDFHHALVDVG